VDVVSKSNFASWSAFEAAHPFVVKGQVIVCVLIEISAQPAHLRCEAVRYGDIDRFVVVEENANA